MNPLGCGDKSETSYGMISTWEDVFNNGDLIAEIERYDSIESWAGQAWIIHTSVQVWGNNKFLVIPCHNDEDSDPIMVQSVRLNEHGNWERHRNTGYRYRIFDTGSDRGVPYDEVVERFRQEAYEFLNNNE